MAQRKIEILTAGCPVCDTTVQRVKALTCESCDVQVININEDPAAAARVKALGVERMPIVLVDGQLLDCCRQGGIDEETLLAAGVGSPLP